MFKLFPSIMCFADPVEVCSKLLVRTRGSQTEWTVRVGRRCHGGWLIAIANEQQLCVYKSVHVTKHNTNNTTQTFDLITLLS